MTPQNIVCPKCGALYDQISSAQEMQEMFGISESDQQWMCNVCSHMFDQKSKTSDYEQISIEDLAYRILKDWKDIPKQAYIYADTMTYIDNLEDKVGDDDARTIINYFLTNAKMWKGEVARNIKKELNRRLKS